MGFGESAAVLEILAQFQDQTKEGIDSFGGRLGKLGDVMGVVTKGAAIVTGATVALGSVAIKQFTDAGAAAHEFGTKFGLLPETASKWLVAGQLAGVNNDTLDKGFLNLSRTMNNLNLQLETTGKVGKAQAEVFKDIGINVLDMHGKLRPVPDVLLDVATQFQKMPDGAEKAALAMKLFGKSGAELIPFLDRGKVGIQDLMNQAQGLGLVMSEKDVQASRQFHQSLAELKLRMEGVAVTWGRSLMPLANDFFEVIDGQVLPAVLRFSEWGASKGVPILERWLGNLVALGERGWPKVVSGAKGFLEQAKPLVAPLEAIGAQLIVLAPAVSNASGVFGAFGSASSSLPSLLNLIVLALQLAAPLIKFLSDNASILVPIIWGTVFAFQAWKALNFAQTLLVLASRFIAMAWAEGLATAASTLLGISLLPITIILLAIAGVVALVALAWKNNWGDIQGKTHAVIDFLVPKIQALVDFLTGVWNAAGPIIQAASMVILAPIFAIINAVRIAIDLLQKLGIIKASTSVTGNAGTGPHGSYGLAPIHAATGFEGVVGRPTLFLAGEQEPESVSVRPLGSSVAGGGASDRPIIVQVLLDGKVLAESSATHLNRSRRLAGGAT